MYSRPSASTVDALARVPTPGHSSIIGDSRVTQSANGRLLDNRNPNAVLDAGRQRAAEVTNFIEGLTKVAAPIIKDALTQRFGISAGSSIKALFVGGIGLAKRAVACAGGSGGGNVASNYALCNKCHVVEGTNSLASSGVHSEHLQQGAACTTCHDPHGVIGGTAITSRALMNFDTAVVRPSGGYLGYFTTTAGHGGCYLSCHGEGHTPRTY